MVAVVHVATYLYGSLLVQNQLANMGVLGSTQAIGSINHYTDVPLAHHVMIL